MGYRRTLALSSSRRDVLAVVVVAVVTAFLVGATLMLGLTAAEVDETTASLTRETTVEYVHSPAASSATGETLRLPVAETTANGRSYVVVGIPPDAPPVVESASYPWADATVPGTPESNVLRGDVDATDRRQFPTRSGRRTLTVEPARSTSILPPEWFVAHPETVRSLGTTGALVVRPDPTVGSDGGLDQTKLTTAGTYLRQGASSLTGLLWLVTVGEALIVGVIVYSLTRTSVVDRSTTIFAARATGATKPALLRLFALRGGLRVAAGVGLGACAGLALPVAAALGTGYLRPAEVAAPRVVDTVVGTAVPAAAGLVAFGAAVGYVVAHTAVPTAPAETPAATAVAGRGSAGEDPAGALRRLRDRLEPTVLEWRTVVPTAATLAVFVSVGVLVLSSVATLAPLAQTTENAVVQSGVPHPLASSVDTDVADAVRADGGRASPEILVPEVVGERSRPYLARGVNYTAFAGITESRLVAGHAPRNPHQAVVGSDLAETIDVGVGDSLLMGGGAVPGVTRVTVVGEFEAPGMTDDQLLVPLETARHLSAVQTGEANLVRVEGGSAERYATGSDAGGESAETGIVVRNYTVPDEAVVGENVTVSVRLTNFGRARHTRTLELQVGSNATRRNVTLDSGETRTVRMSLPVARPGEQRVAFAGVVERLAAYPPDAARLEFAPTRAPPGATLTVRAVTARGDPLPNATVALARETVRTNRTGAARVTVPDRPGSYGLVVDGDARSATTYPLSVAPNATRDLSAELEMPPPTVDRDATPLARLTLSNPWDRSLTRTVVFETDSGWNRTRRVTVEPNGEATLDARLPAPPDGDGSLTVHTAAGVSLANGTYRVTEVSRTATYGQGSGLGAGRAVESVVTTLVYVQGAFVVFAGLTVLGSTSIVSAQAMYARRRYVGLYRVTGASPGRLLRVFLGDALRIGVASSVLAVGVALLSLRALSAAGVLTAFGVRIPIHAPPELLVGLGVLNVGIVLVSVGAVTLRSLRADPAEQSKSAGR